MLVSKVRIIAWLVVVIGIIVASLLGLSGCATLDSISPKSHDFVSFFKYECTSNHVPVKLALAVIHAESDFQSSNISSNSDSYDVGLMQLNSKCFTDLAAMHHGLEPFDPMNPYHNVEVGIRYLSKLHRDLGNWTAAVLAYNCGASRVWNDNIPHSSWIYAHKIMKEAFNG